jgi:UDP-3-O-[3-hydroxymyristoyl] glucosamine N-acyltransferase
MTSTPRRFRLAQLSERFNLELRGDPEHEVGGVGTLAAAGPDQISFLSNRSYVKQLPETRAGAVILNSKDAEFCPVNCLLSDNPYLSYARVATVFDTRPVASPGVHPSAVVDPKAQLGAEVHVGPNAVVGADCIIGRGSAIGPGCVVGAGASVGEGCRFEANVTIAPQVTIGNRVIIHSGAVIGADGFGIAFTGEHWEKVPQLGSVIIGDDCEIGANTAIDRGAIEDTVLEQDVRIDNLVQIAHNVRIGAHTAIAGCAGVAGSTHIGRNCLIGGGTGIEGHLTIADGVTVGAMSALQKSITESGVTWGSAVPGRPLREWQRSLAHLNKLDHTIKRIRALEQQARKNSNNEQ